MQTKKVSIIGLGNVGLTVAYALLLRNVVSELVLISRSPEKAEGEKLDLEHGLPFLNTTSIVSSADYRDAENSDVIIISAGAPQKPGQTRLELIQENKKIIASIAEQLKPYVKNSVVLMVTNPVDALTYYMDQLLELPEGRVFGTGTMLDTARFRFHLSEYIDVNPRSIHAYILGEHGDSSFPVLANASLGGQPLTEFPGLSRERIDQAFQQAKGAAARIIQAKGATFYAIGVVVSQIVAAVLEDKKSVLPVSTVIHNFHGQSGLSISVPCIVGRNGVERVLHSFFSEKEEQQFQNSCEVIKKTLAEN